jgi:hypothetical protein
MHTGEAKRCRPQAAIRDEGGQLKETRLIKIKHAIRFRPYYRKEPTGHTTAALF